MEIKQLPLQYQTGNAKKISIGSGCLIIELDKILLVRGKGGENWKFPGGHVDDQESIRQTADREVEEELGCQVELFGEPFFYLYQPYPELDIILIHYQARISAGTPKPTSEIAECKWSSLEDIPDNVYPNVISAINHFQQ